MLAAAVAVGALSYGASIALYIAAAHELGATRAQAVFASAPFVGAALAFAVVGEPFGAAHLAACLLLIPSIAALFLSQHSHAHAHEALEHVHSHRHDDGHHLHAHPEPSAGAAPRPPPPPRAARARAPALAGSPPPARPLALASARGARAVGSAALGRRE